MPKLQVSGQKQLTQSCILLSQAFNVAFATSFESAAGEHGDSWARMNIKDSDSAARHDGLTNRNNHQFFSFRTYSIHFYFNNNYYTYISLKLFLDPWGLVSMASRLMCLPRSLIEPGVMLILHVDTPCFSKHRDIQQPVSQRQDVLPRLRPHLLYWSGLQKGKRSFDSSFAVALSFGVAFRLPSLRTGMCSRSNKVCTCLVLGEHLISSPDHGGELPTLFPLRRLFSLRWSHLL